MHRGWLSWRTRSKILMDKEKEDGIRGWRKNSFGIRPNAYSLSPQISYFLFRL